MSAAAPRALVICPVVPYPPVSGGQKRTLRLLEAAQRAGAAPHLLCSASPAGQRGAEELRARGWRVDLLAEGRPSAAGRARQHVARRPSPYLDTVATRLRDQRDDPPAFVQAEHVLSAYYERDHPSRRWALSAHNVDSEMLASVARARRPLARDWVRAWNRALATRTVERRVSARADAVLCTSQSDAAYFEALGARVVLAPNGVDEELLDVPAELPAGEIVLFFGRLDHAPNAIGLERFLRTGWPRVLASRPAASLRIVGGGLQPRLERALAATPRTTAVGVVDDIAAELAAARLVIVPVWQGGGTRTKVMEALAAARPVVGASLGVAGIGFVSGRHGLIDDDPGGLADATSALLGDAHRATTLGREGRAHVGKLVWRRTLADAEALYAQWVEEAEPRRRESREPAMSRYSSV